MTSLSIKYFIYRCCHYFDIFLFKSLFSTIAIMMNVFLSSVRDIIFNIMVISVTSLVVFSNYPEWLSTIVNSF